LVGSNVNHLNGGYGRRFDYAWLGSVNALQLKKALILIFAPISACIAATNYSCCGALNFYAHTQKTT